MAVSTKCLDIFSSLSTTMHIFSSSKIFMLNYANIIFSPLGSSSKFLFKFLKFAKRQFVFMIFVEFQVSWLIGKITASKFKTFSSSWRFYIWLKTKWRYRMWCRFDISVDWSKMTRRLASTSSKYFESNSWLIICGFLSRFNKEMESENFVRLFRWCRLSISSGVNETFSFLMAWDLRLFKDSTSRTSLTRLKVRGDSISELED